MTQDEGHGTATLPVEYVREHVRLGYAATEHGYESATVTAGIELASPATTRRGLYVGVTRGRDENLICVITESGDVVEARDVLDGILAVDRADIPAVTQRRFLATQHQQARQRSEPSTRPGRCQIPDWFAAVLADAQHALADAEHTLASRRVERVRRAAAITAAEGELADVARETAPHRERLAVDAKRADGARRDHAAAERRLAGSGRRGRRAARRELDIAERVLDRVTAVLERTGNSAAADVERYRASVAAVEGTRTDLRHHDLATQLDRLDRRAPDLTRAVAALDTWQRWANGDTITVQKLHDTVEILGAAAGTGRREDYRALGEVIQTWAATAGLDLQIADRRPPALEHAGPELGL